MNQKLKYILVAVFFIGLITVFIKNNDIQKWIVDYVNSELIEKNKRLQIKIDSLNLVSKASFEKYQLDLENLDQEKKLLLKKVDSLILIEKKYEAKIIKYVPGDFDNNFELFSSHITGTEHRSN